MDRLHDPNLELQSALFCLTVCFAVGGVGGCIFAGRLGADTQTRLLDYFSSYFAAFDGNEPLSLSSLSAVWEILRWPILTFLLGFTALGVVGLPAVFCVRGFLLSYAAAVLVRLYGVTGLGVSLAVFGVSAFMVLPALFILGVDSFRGAGAMAVKQAGDSRRNPPDRQRRLLRAGCCGVLLALAAVLQLRLTPVLLTAAAKLL